MITERKDITSICENISIDTISGHLKFAGRDTTLLVEKYGTPLYLLDEEYVRKMCQIYRDAMKDAFDAYSKPLFASKSLCFKKIYPIIGSEGLGADVASVGELFTALESGFPPENLMFHGNNKTDDDIQFAISHKVGCFVCDNREELEVIDRIAGENKIKQRIF